MRATGATFEPWTAPSSRACTVSAPIRLLATGLSFTPPLETSCAMALAWTRFEPEVIALAQSWLGRPPRSVLHMGSYGCRRMSGNRGRLSLHGTAEALDLAGFVMADGRAVRIDSDWHGPGPAGRFLRAVAKAACRSFSVVLTPDSDSAHHDHLHLDIGPWQLCG